MSLINNHNIFIYFPTDDYLQLRERNLQYLSESNTKLSNNCITRKQVNKKRYRYHET